MPVQPSAHYGASGPYPVEPSPNTGPQQQRTIATDDLAPSRGAPPLQQHAKDPFIPQLDGHDDRVEPRSSAESSPEAQPAKENDELNSDLDDEEDDVDHAADIDDLVLCLYEKVHRARNKWKCNFKSGIINIDGKDYAFNRLNGDFEW